MSKIAENEKNEIVQNVERTKDTSGAQVKMIAETRATKSKNIRSFFNYEPYCCYALNDKNKVIEID